MKLSILLFLLILLLSQLLGMNKILIKVKEVKNYVKKGNIQLKTQILNRTMTNKTIQACLGISWLRTPFLLRAIPFSRILDHHGSLKWLRYPESTHTYFMAFQIMMLPLLQPLKRPSLDISLSLRIINITSKKLSIAALVDNDPKLHQRVVLKEETLTKIKHPTSIQNQTNLNILGLYLTSFIITLELLKLYAIDPKGTKHSLVNSPTCPEFPDSEWTNILARRAVNLDAVLSGYYSTSNNNERVEEIGDLEICFGTVNPTKTVSTAGEWSIAWNRASQATSTAFPHRAGELAEYAEYIVGLFAATDAHFHDCVILFDKAVRRRIGTRRDLELTDLNKFSDLRSTHMDSIGAAVVQRASLATNIKPNSTSQKKIQEPCNRWNEGLCALEASQCR
ncbi:uncharacterized protein LACBIDRAFT_329907 [Laccaria bicolor S238N-H82]|uniref:Predicted protein n=1 Tax=Laccaria bicolor (strain S238N-H82 / ATCC MYA-4686) TaxID=486041 RepID=B0DJL1_LACBS|nr:uncharacterized protein LACBIDRAFT_329907 [Laccaria bicolor S238N-H82]EDR05137.1 predicted protein [Laccaria bicolor S238N-H82]|eukprot:XP_001884102.1 predicted protein [Laccaria bicolor S238N-H82]